MQVVHLLLLEAGRGPLPVDGSQDEGVACSCAHALDCWCGCHDHFCDPAARHCDRSFLPDEAGFTTAGCALCTPGAVAPHADGCALIGWHVPVPMAGQALS